MALADLSTDLALLSQREDLLDPEVLSSDPEALSSDPEALSSDPEALSSSSDRGALLLTDTLLAVREVRGSLRDPLSPATQ